MASLDIPSLMQANAARWSHMVIDFDALSPLQKQAAALIASKSRYQAVAAQTGVPWPVIAVIHERECSQNWNLNIAQGDPWNKVSVRVPAGRGPFASWEEAAIDALTNCNPFLSRWSHWEAIEGVLTRLESYNGGGYAERNLPSPYIWSRTDQYVCGKYDSDGVFDPDTIDAQQGCAGLLLCMMQQDPTILADFPSWGAPPAQPSLTGPDGVEYDTLWLQKTLNQLKANPQLKPDGVWGDNTRTALQNYQASVALAASGRYNLPTLNSLVNTLAAAPPDATPATVA
jgi:lysozyme family protein